LVHRKRDAGSYEMTRVIQWSIASQPNPGRKRIGHQTKNVNGLAFRVRLGDRLHGRSAEGHDHIELAVGDLPRDGVERRHVAFGVELTKRYILPVDKAVVAQGLEGSIKTFLEHGLSGQSYNRYLGNSLRRGSPLPPVRSEQQHRSQDNEREAQR